jgi:Tfp pilus assembly protein PilO
MKITKVQQYIFGAVLGFILLIAAYYYVVLKPINAEIASLKSTLEEKKKDLDEAKKMITKYAEFKKRADSIQRELEWVQNRIPKMVDRPKMVENVNFLQTRSGLSLTSFKFGTSTVAKDIYVEVPAELKFLATYKELLSFFYEMSLSKSLMTTKDLKISFYSDTTNPLSGKTITGMITLNGVQAK